MTYGVYISYYLEHDHFSGGTPFRYAWVGGLAVATALICAPILSWLRLRVKLRVQYLLGEYGVRAIG
jgi:hypothetical protein